MNISEFSRIFGEHPTYKSLADNLLENSEHKAIIHGLCGSEPWFFANLIYKQLATNILIILPDSDEASYVHSDLASIVGAKNLIFFPSSHKRSIQYNQPDRTNMLLRTEALEKLTDSTKKYIIITSPEALAEQVISKDAFQDKIHFLHVGEQVDSSFINELLYEFGFERVDFVVEPGQFSVRGSIIDIFSFSNDVPYRVDFFGDEVESMRTFNIDDQRSIETVDKLAIVPDIQNQKHVDSFIPFLEYVHDFATIVVDIAMCYNILQTIFEQTIKKTAKENVANMRLSLLSSEELLKRIQNKRVCEINSTSYFAEATSYDFLTIPQPAINKNFELFGKQLIENQAHDYVNYFFTQSMTQYERIQDIFKEINPHVRLAPIITSLHKGFIDHDIKICCYTDHEIFERYHTHSVRKKVVSSDSFSIQDLKNLVPGDFVVHIDHGIGKFTGLERVQVNGKVQETIKLVYKDNDILYVGIHNLHKISKYKGKEGTPPTIHKLGSAVWQTTKQKTKNKVKDIAKDLIALYAERRVKEGFRFSADTYLQQELEASFFFEDTPDQTTATKKVKQAMEAPYPMDMLVCGDVGFGKTEIAIRAAFKAVTDGKQVAILVPTTILALQHYKTFASRLKEFPCTVDYICRLRSTKQQKETLQQVKLGKTDILIGTHRLIGKDVLFKDLGLLIIDEEQKFGVGMKEKLKQMKVNVDTLTLTATPIPRTLQFSLMGARDLSIINTPPPNRHPIVTEVHQFNEDIIKEAIIYEVERGGQVFIINNRIQNIYELEKMIQRICPKVKTIVGHGQMDGTKLEGVMLDFINQEYDVLLATTIVESGLDIPNANTIIINDAHNFGLSDLHQLRGRVGRSNKKAYCYLLAPPKHVLTKEARQRLHAIEEYSDLGSGFNISMQDLDIRGAGNLLGGEQSGFITDIGYETYQKILDEALLELRENEYKDLFNQDSENTEETSNRFQNMQFVNDCYIETDMELLFPETYIESTKERVKMYRELDNIQNETDLQQFEEQLRDRFGEIPEQSYALLDVVRLRWLAVTLGIERIILKNNTMINYFIAKQESIYYQSPIFGTVLQFVQENPRICTMKEANGKLTLRFENIKKVREGIEKLGLINDRKFENEVI